MSDNNSPNSNNIIEGFANFVKSFGEAIEKLTKDLHPAQKLIGGILFGIIAILIPALWSISSEQGRLFVWFITIGVVLSIGFLIYAFNIYDERQTRKNDDLRPKLDNSEKALADITKQLSEAYSKAIQDLTDIENELPQNYDHEDIKQRLESLAQLIKQRKQQFSSFRIDMEAVKNIDKYQSEMATDLAQRARIIKAQKSKQRESK